MRILKTSIIPAVFGGLAVALAFIVAGVGGGDTTTVVQQAPLASPAAADGGGSLTAREIYRRDAPGVVFITAQGTRTQASPFDLLPQERRSQSTGSGFVIDGDGHVVTNWHVVEGAETVSVKLDDEKVRTAKVVGSDPSTDLAVLKIDPDGLKLQPLQLGDSGKIQVGDPTVAIGNPFGLDRTLTTGVVSALQRRIEAPNGFTIDNVIQTDAAINPGNSGGPLIDALGRVIGINSQIATGGAAGSGGNIGIGFAVPINTAKQVVDQIKSGGKVERAYLGITGTTIDGSLSALNLATDEGVLIQEVSPGGPAAKAGLRGGDSQVTIGGRELALGGDVIQEIDGRRMESMDEVGAYVQSKKPGDEIEVQILRDRDEKTVKVKLGTRPAQAPAR